MSQDPSLLIKTLAIKCKNLVMLKLQDFALFAAFIIHTFINFSVTEAWLVFLKTPT